jgi:hypothetical protein
MIVSVINTSAEILNTSDECLTFNCIDDDDDQTGDADLSEECKRTVSTVTIPLMMATLAMQE